MGKFLTYYEVKSFIEDNNCVLISDKYINAHDKLTIQCKCGNIFNVSYNTFKNGQRQCRECGIKIRNDAQKLSFEFVKNYIEVDSNSNYKLLSNEYVNNRELLDMICDKGHKIKMRFANFQQGDRCSICSGKNFQRNSQSFREEVYNLVRDEYSVLGDFTRTKDKIKMKHNTCGHVWDIVVSSFLLGVRCPMCQHRSYRKTTEEFKQEVCNLVGNEYEVVGEYKNCKTHIILKHVECNNTYKVLPNNFLRGRRCPFCFQSKGEQKIRQVFEYNSILFETEYDKFKNLLSDKSNPLRFDFAVLDINKNVALLVEFDGQQHFDWIEGWQTKDDFKTLQYHDQLKNEYCKYNNIPLLRIPYWDFDKIEEILEKELKKYNLINTKNKNNKINLKE